VAANKSASLAAGDLLPGHPRNEGVGPASMPVMPCRELQDGANEASYLLRLPLRPGASWDRQAVNVTAGISMIAITPTFRAAATGQVASCSKRLLAVIRSAVPKPSVNRP
jgi:hypothetical protein